MSIPPRPPTIRARPRARAAVGRLCLVALASLAFGPAATAQSPGDALRALVQRASSDGTVDSDALMTSLSGLASGECALFAERCLAGRPAGGGVTDHATGARLVEALLALVQRVALEADSDAAGGVPQPAWLARRRVAIELAGTLGGDSEVETLITFGRPPVDMDAGVTRGLENGITRALADIALRLGGGMGHLDSAYRDGFSGRLVVLALVRTQDLRALQTLPQLLGRVPELDSFALSQLAVLARDVRAPVGDSGLGRVRSYLGHSSRDLRRTAAQALGFLDDAAAVRPLIDLLADQELEVRQASYLALRRITAMTIDPGPRRWRTWFDEETAWWGREGQALLDLVRVRGRGPQTMARVLSELGARRLHRREIAPQILHLLDDPDCEVVRMALSALIALRANDPATIRALQVVMLDHPDRQSAVQAERGLTVITRIRDPRRLPLIPEAR